MIVSSGLSWQFTGGPRMVFPDVCVPQGGVAVLRGPSGSGKSTWLSLVAGLRRPASGSLEVADRSLTGSGAPVAAAELDRWRAAHVGFLPQRLHLSAALTVHENLALAFFAAGTPRNELRIQQVLKSLGLSALVSRRPRQLSGGQAQRVALARALLLQPRVLLVDEPTASLDDDACGEALALLWQSAREVNATLVVATHDRRAVEALTELSSGNLSQIRLKPASDGCF